MAAHSGGPPSGLSFLEAMRNKSADRGRDKLAHKTSWGAKWYKQDPTKMDSGCLHASMEIPNIYVQSEAIYSDIAVHESWALICKFLGIKLSHSTIINWVEQN